MISYNPQEFPLTFKWRRLINLIAYQNRFHIDEGIQEALILEWSVKQKITEDLKYREHYFRKVLYQRLYSIGRDWWARHKVNLSRKDNLDDDFDVVSQIVQVRPFDEIYFEEIIAHISQMLYQIDITASEIFLIRMRNTELLWKQIREHYYRKMSYNSFSSKVRLIKEMAVHELVGA